MLKEHLVIIFPSQCKMGICADPTGALEVIQHNKIRQDICADNLKSRERAAGNY